MSFSKACTASVGLLLIAAMVSGCASRPSKAEVDKKVREALASASPEWKEITYETKADDTVNVVTANREVDGKTYGFVLTGGGGSGGVAVRTPLNEWLCKYRYEKGKEVNAEKMDGGKEEDVKKFQTLASDFAATVLKACP